MIKRLGFKLHPLGHDWDKGDLEVVAPISLDPNLKMSRSCYASRLVLVGKNKARLYGSDTEFPLKKKAVAKAVIDATIEDIQYDIKIAVEEATRWDVTIAAFNVSLELARRLQDKLNAK